MNFFTYNDYLDYEKSIKIKKELEREEKTIKNKKRFQCKKYTTNTKEVLDKIIENLLNDKKEVVNFINEFIQIKTKKWQKQDLKENKNFRIKDKVYQKNGKEFYILIKHQVQINYHISYEILLKSMEFMKIWEKYKSKKQFKTPILAPIIIYTGNKKWKTQNNLKKEKIKNITYEKNGMYLKYNLIDANQYSTQELLKKESLIANIIALKRYQNNKKRKEILETLINNTKEIDKFLKLNKIKNIYFD